MLDIPGLIEGASDGKGLGLAFLRHTEGCRLLIHVVNGQSETPVEDWIAINTELKRYSPLLANTTQVVVVSKADLPDVAARLPATLEALRKIVPHQRIMCISAHSGLNLKQLIGKTHNLLLKEKAAAKGSSADRTSVRVRTD